MGADDHAGQDAQASPPGYFLFLSESRVFGHERTPQTAICVGQWMRRKEEVCPPAVMVLLGMYGAGPVDCSTSFISLSRPGVAWAVPCLLIFGLVTAVVPGPCV